MLVVLLLILAAAVWRLGGVTGPERTWTASASLQLVVKNLGSDEFTAYDQDALTWTVVSRTLAGITADQRFVEEGRRRLHVPSAERSRYTVEIQSTAPSG